MKKMLLTLLIVLSTIISCTEDNEINDSPKYRIVFSKGEGSQTDLYQIDEKGENVIQLTSTDGFDTFPIFSPDGSKILFASSRDGGQHLYMMNADGSQVKRLTNTQSPNYAKGWSPQGNYVVYSSGSSGTSTELFVVDTNATLIRQLTDNSDPDYSATWSPDGSQIAFHSHRSPAILSSQIYIIDSDGTGEYQLTNSTNGAYLPDWHPYDDVILFLDYDSLGLGHLATITKNGNNYRTLMDHYGEERVFNAVWSPCGDYIAVALVDSVFGWDRTLYVVEFESGSATKISNSDHDNSNPSWSPDGEWVIYSSQVGGCSSLKIVRRDGSEEIELSDVTQCGDYAVFPH
jgi:Tol biopolymer transport system component